MSINPSLMLRSQSIARLCPLSLSAKSTHFSPCSIPGQTPLSLTCTGLLVSPLLMPPCSSHTHWSFHKCTLRTQESPVQNHFVASYCSRSKYPQSSTGPSSTTQSPASRLASYQTSRPCSRAPSPRLFVSNMPCSFLLQAFTYVSPFSRTPSLMHSLHCSLKCVTHSSHQGLSSSSHMIALLRNASPSRLTVSSFRDCVVLLPWTSLSLIHWPTQSNPQ